MDQLSTNFDLRCGEIYLTTLGEMEFHCTLCEESYKNFSEYNQHLSQNHYPLGYSGGKHLEMYSEDYEEVLVVLDDDDGSSSFIFDSRSDCEEYPESEIEPLSFTGTISDTLPELNKNVNPSHNKTNGRSKDSLSDILKKLHSETKVPRTISRRRSRPGELKFICPHCEYAGHDRSNFINHVKRHFGDKPHKCTDCGKHFYTRNELKRHSLTHTGERPYLCHDCGRAFPSKHKLELHIKRHLNKRDKHCETCGKSFFNSEQLNEHMTVHSDERRFRCEYCNAAFKRRRALYTHKKLHANKREYQCRLCSASFNQSSGLRSHMKRKHSTVITGEG